MDITIRIADVNIKIHSIYDEVYTLCRGFLSDGTADISVSVTHDDIAFEHKMNIREARAEGNEPLSYPDPYLETLAVYRKIAVKMLSYDTFLMHGAVIAVGERSWIFTAPSGTGKTTHIRLWLENIKGSYVVNGDKPLIRVGDDISVFGTPWAGKEGMCKNTGTKLCGIVLLGRGKDNRIMQIPAPQALPILIQQSYRPNNKKDLEKTLELIGRLIKRIHMYRLECNMHPEAALTAYKALCGEDKNI